MEWIVDMIHEFKGFIAVDFFTFTIYQRQLFTNLEFDMLEIY